MRDSLQAAYPLWLAHGTRDPNLAHTSQPPTDIFDPKEHAHTEALRNILTVFSYIEDSLPKPGPSEPVTYLLDDPQADEPHAPQKKRDNQGTNRDTHGRNQRRRISLGRRNG